MRAFGFVMFVVSMLLANYFAMKTGEVRMARKFRKQVLEKWRDTIWGGDPNYTVRMNDFTFVYNEMMRVIFKNKKFTELEPYVEPTDAELHKAMTSTAEYFKEKGHSKLCELIVVPFKDAHCTCGYNSHISYLSKPTP